MVSAAATQADAGDTSAGGSEPRRRFQMVVAVTVGNEGRWGMGFGGQLPWESAQQRLPGDLRRFKDITTSATRAGPAGGSPGARRRRNAVVMGRLTYESIPQRLRPLPGRLNVVLSRSPDASQRTPGAAQDEDLVFCGGLMAALRILASEEWRDEIERVFVIGGSQVFREAMEAPASTLCDAIHVTTVHKDYPCDVFFPHEPLLTHFRVWACTPRTLDNGVPTSFTTYLPWVTPSAPVPGLAVPPTTQGTSLDVGAAACSAADGAAGSWPQSEAADADGTEGREALGDRREMLNVACPSGTSMPKVEGARAAGGRGDSPGTGPDRGELNLLLPRAVLELHEEYQYLNLIRNIIGMGNAKGDRTGTGTLSCFGAQMRFNLRSTFPLLTTKRVFWRGVVEELLWFISGSTNANLLREKGVHIWDGNGSRAFLDGLGFADREEGDLGPVYGFQWRHFGAEYKDMHSEYRGQGVDQLAEVVDKLRHRSEDRRIILSAWNPAALHLMALPPCHLLAQFYVANGELSCQMYQRSCDMGLGVPFNIASYALLTCMLAHVCDLVPGELVHVLGDAHVYNNHVEPLEEQLKNTPRPFPVLKIKRKVDEIDQFQASDFDLIGYLPHRKIAMEMAV